MSRDPLMRAAAELAKAAHRAAELDRQAAAPPNRIQRHNNALTYGLASGRHHHSRLQEPS
jgi:hypothetical protein